MSLMNKLMNLSSALGANVMAATARSAGMDGMMVVSRAVYEVPAELRWTVAATSIREEQCAASPAEAADWSDWSSHSATELTLSLSTRVGLHQYNSITLHYN